jgi:hypothetical protein
LILNLTKGSTSEQTSPRLVISLLGCPPLDHPHSPKESRRFPIVDRDSGPVHGDEPDGSGGSEAVDSILSNEDESSSNEADACDDLAATREGSRTTRSGVRTSVKPDLETSRKRAAVVPTTSVGTKVRRSCGAPRARARSRQRVKRQRRVQLTA